MMGHYDSAIEEWHDECRQNRLNNFLNKKAKAASKWENRFMKLASEIAKWSKDPSTQIGAIAVRNRRVIAQGYNGFPQNVEDHVDRLEDRELKYKFMIHAEMNMIYNAAREGVSLEGSDVYVFGLPTCSECAKGLIQAGVRNVYVDEACLNDRWADSWDFSKRLYWEGGLNYELLSLQGE